MKTNSRAGFTLVELLVVIGIIALLVSILLPSLNKARGQANLIVCQSNLRSIGQLIGIYEANNRGYLPYGDAAVNFGAPNGQEWQWEDVVTLAGQPTQYASGPAYVQANGYMGGPQGNQALDFASVFHDVDTPQFGWSLRAGSYNANPRLLPYSWTPISPSISWTLDGMTSYKSPYHLRPFSSVQRASEKMMIWDGALYVSGGVITGSNSVDTQLDNAMFDYGGPYGHYFCDSSPYVYNTSYYADPIGAGNPPGAGNSMNPGSVTKASQAAENKDAYNYGWLPYSLRFRHNNNTKANVLFADGHVESRGLIDIKAIDVCVNPF